MRIIAGQWPSVLLRPPPAPDTRPILDQVKEALFNILGARLAMPGILPPIRVLDLFAGTGSLGLEALSRGAAFCTFVEGQAENARTLRENIDRLRAGSVAEVRHENAWTIGSNDDRSAPRYGLVFIDPPFRDAQGFRPKDKVNRLLARLSRQSMVMPDGTVVLRHPARSRCDSSTFAWYTLLEQRTYGEMTLTFLSATGADGRGADVGTEPESSRMSTKTAKQAAESIIHKLSAAGFEALLAGGCVRDLLLGREPKDYDVATSARPEDVCRLYPKAQKVGAHFGVVIVRQFGHPVEVATFRKDGPYRDGRHPEDVVFSSAREDAQRRDFTVNGMFYDVSTSQAIDYVHGQEDLRNRVIQAIGNPEQRFEEDHLRMLRAVRFASRLGFHIEQETFEAIYNRAEKIAEISSERIRAELEMILADPNRATGFDLLCATGLLPHLWPGSAWSTAGVKKSGRALAALPAEASFPLTLAAMLYHQDVQVVGRVCRDLTCSNKVRDETVWLLKALKMTVDEQIRTLADLKLLMAGPCFSDLLHLLDAYSAAEDFPKTTVDRLRSRSAAVPPDQIAPEPLVDGEDLLQLGLPQGPAYKKILDELYYRQLNLELTSREEALHAAGRLSLDGR